ncbi:MAG: tetratricopeptide repeat protein [Henriciella sp.]|nr:tetratricopeptide repeat protein [Henriciella sp.]MBO6696876.1 tetratricopeptide repeat protein [Henriciella sp.]
MSKLIWESRFKPQARASLRQCLHDLKRELQRSGLDILEVSNTQLAVNPDLIDTDLHVLETALSESDDERATQLLLELAGKPLLANIDLGDALDKWLTTQRGQVENRLRMSAQRLLSTLRAGGLNERHDALEQAWQGWSGVSRLRQRSGLAILPFKQIDELGGDLLLADAVVEELSSRLGGLNGLAVVGQTSVAALASSALTLPEMAEKLGVTHFIEGAIHRSAGSVKLTMRLIEGASDKQIWSDQINEPEAYFFDQRKLIGENAIAGLSQAMGLKQNSRPVRTMTSSREAYALYLQGRTLTQRIALEGALPKAVELLERALKIDPDFAECWTALAEAHIHVAVYTPCLERVALSEKAAACARRALDLDPNQGYAYAILSIHEWTCFNPAGALEYALEAYRLEPNNADVTLRLGSSLLYLGRTREALPYVEAAIEQDPAYGRNYVMLCVAHLNLGNLEAAVRAGQSMVDLGIPGVYLGVAQAAAGDHETAVETYYETRRYVGTIIMSPPGAADISDEARDFYLKTAAEGICGGDEEARQTYCNLIEMLHQTLLDPYDQTVAWPAVWMGHSELAMKVYREQIHPANMPGLMSLWTEIDPICRTLQHPDFMAFAEDIGMVEAWEKYGWPDLIPSDPR